MHEKKKIEKRMHPTRKTDGYMHSQSIGWHKVRVNWVTVQRFKIKKKTKNGWFYLDLCLNSSIDERGPPSMSLLNFGIIPKISKHEKKSSL